VSDLSHAVEVGMSAAEQKVIGAGEEYTRRARGRPAGHLQESPAL
jgi:hypothetical protein